MSLYRQANGRGWRVPVIAGALALLAGAAIGFTVGRGTATEPSLEELVEGVGEEVEPALSALELVGIEYPQGVKDGKIVAQTEYEAALSQAETAVATLEQTTDLRLISSGHYDEAISEAREVVSLIEGRTPAAVVMRAAEAARATIEAILSGTISVSADPA